MSGGLLDFITHAAEIQCEHGCTAEEAHEIVGAAYTEYMAMLEDRTPPTTIGNVVYANFRPRAT